MEVVFARCAGLDVHSKVVVVCRRIIGPDGKLDKQVRTFGTTTGELLALADWLAAARVTHVAMESTGVFPAATIRELRDLTRHRATLVDQHTAVANRIHKILEDANIKLGTVASDILGASGRAMLEAIVAGESDPAVLAELARRRLRAKLPALREALQGRITEHHRFLFATLLEQLRFLEAQLARLDERIAEKSRPFEAALRWLRTIPGVGQRIAENLLAEIGPEMAVFPSAGHLASWGGMCPGNNESAGKRKSGKTPQGNRWLRRSLIEAAWAAARTKQTCLAAQYRRLAARRGKRGAVVAVGHTWSPPTTSFTRAAPMRTLARTTSTVSIPSG